MIQNPEVPGPGSYTDELIKPSQKFDHTAPQVDRFGNPVIRRTVIETTPGGKKNFFLKRDRKSMKRELFLYFIIISL